MAITNEASIKAILKTWYEREGVQNLLTKNSRVLNKIKGVRVEGKTQNMSALYGFGGAVSADYTVALDNATNQAKNVEYAVEPGQLFSVYTLNAKEVQASLSRRGAYMKVAGNKHFAASEGLRKSLAAAFYGRGFGELAVLGNAYSFTANTDIDITVPRDTAVKVGPGSRLAVKTSVKATAESTVLQVIKKVGTKLTVRPNTTYSSNATDILCLAGSIDSSGQPLLPVGLGGWLPSVAGRSGSDWDAYISENFYGVARSVATDELAGNFIAPKTGEKKSETIQRAIMAARLYGTEADYIVMNDEDFLEFSKEIETTNTYFTKTSTKEAKKASVGFADISASFSTNYVGNIIDDPYCPKGQFYVLHLDTVELWSYTNTEPTKDNFSGNEPGKVMNADEDNDKGHEKDPYALLIDDYLSVQQGTPTIDGPSTVVAMNIFATFALWNTSVNAVGYFSDADTSKLVEFQV